MCVCARVCGYGQDDVCESDAAEAETSAEEIAALKETVAESKEKLNALKKGTHTPPPHTHGWMDVCVCVCVRVSHV